MAKCWHVSAIKPSQRRNDVALAGIAALEKEGYRVVAREPTRDMITRGALALQTKRINGQRQQFTAEYAAKMTLAALVDAHDAAPRYGEPGE